MRIIFLLLMLTSACQDYEEESDVEFIGYSQIPYFSEMNFLITKVHEPSWTVGYYFGDNCGLRPKEEKLISNATYLIRLWLDSLRESPLVRQKITNKFYFKNVQQYKGDEPHFENISDEIDFFINYKCDRTWSHVLVGVHPPIIILGKETIRNETGYDPFTILHELGHVLGLMDTYALGNHSVKGESYDYFFSTLGNQLPSVMSGLQLKKPDAGNIPKIEDYTLATDDKKGLEWLYLNYFFSNKTARGNDCYFPGYELELLHENGDRGCVPSNPLIFMIKNGYPTDIIISNLNRETPLQQSINKRTKDQLTFLHYVAMIPNDQGLQFFSVYNNFRGILAYANVNITDRRGQTPLHYAIRAGNNKIVKQLIRTNNWEIEPIDLNKQLPNGMTYLHFAVQFANVETSCLLLALENTDQSLEDQWGLTARQRATQRLKHWSSDQYRDQQQIDRIRQIIAMLDGQESDDCSSY